MQIIVHEIVAMILGVITGITGGFLYYRGKYNRLQTKSRLQLIDSFHREVRLVLWDATRNTRCCNAILLHMHNGGPRMAAGMRQYSSAVEEAPVTDKHRILEDWQNVFVDREYREMISELQEAQALRIATGEMDDGMLRRKYEATDVTASIVFWCYETEGGPYYISFPTDTDNPLDYLGGVDFSKLEAINNRVRNILRKYEKLGVLH